MIYEHSDWFGRFAGNIYCMEYATCVYYVGNVTEHASAIMFAMKDKLVSFLTFVSNIFIFLIF